MECRPLYQRRAGISTAAAELPWPGLAWVLSISGRDAACFTQSEGNSTETVSVQLDAVRRHGLPAVGSV